jgi:hypothetical protein
MLRAMSSVNCGCESDAITVTDILPLPLAQDLHQWLATQARWGLRLSDGESHLGLTPDVYAGSTRSEIQEAVDLAYQAALRGYAYLRQELWLPPHAEAHEVVASPTLASLVQFLRGAEFAQLLAQAVGSRNAEMVRFAIVRYRRGHFCGFAERKPSQALLGFSLCLTPQWNVSWGGLLQHRTVLGSVGIAFLPRLNCLTVHRLHDAYGVSMVAPYAQADAYYVVGEASTAPRAS